MRRRVSPAWLIGSALLLVAAIVWSQAAAGPEVPTPYDPAPPLPPQLFVAPEPARTVNLATLPLAPLQATADSASDLCTTATLMSFSAANPADSSTTIVNTMTESGTDPALSCTWGLPLRPEGFRTAWYEFVAPFTGNVVFDTEGTAYDTVVSVYSAEDSTTPETACSSLVAVGCNDDSQGFSSSLSVGVTQGVTYFVEVADWQSGVSGEATLLLSALLAPVDSFWQRAGEIPQGGISRHAAVLRGNNFYVLGGQTSFGDAPDLSNRLQRFETPTRNWFDLAPIPGAGLANTTAALVQDKIYVPGGYNGNNNTFDNTHWVYDIGSNTWSERSPIPQAFLPAGLPFAYAASAVPSSQNRYFLAGGLVSREAVTSTFTVSDKFYAYTPSNDSWLELSPMSGPRYGHTAGWVDGRICVAGGLAVFGNVILPNGECFAPGGSWTPTGEMHFPRYFADSAVGPDGRWYVFGGIRAQNGMPIAASQTEAYDPATNSWTLLDSRFDLGGVPNWPARAWPRGDFVGTELWAIGGSELLQDERPLSLVERVVIVGSSGFLPGIPNNVTTLQRPDDNFANARPLALNVPQSSNFDGRQDLYDTYTFNVAAPAAVTVNLTNVPDDSNYDVFVFTENKLLLASGTNLQGHDEHVPVNLSAGRYYVLLVRVFPLTDPNTQEYTLLVQE